MKKKTAVSENLPDISGPCGANYCSNDKAWMRSDNMIKLNNKLKHTHRQDNAPSHPSSMKGMFSNIKIEFHSKNTTSRTQPLDAGIIKTWKVHYRRKLLRYIASEIDDHANRRTGNKTGGKKCVYLENLLGHLS